MCFYNELLLSKRISGERTRFIYQLSKVIVESNEYRLLPRPETDRKKKCWIFNPRLFTCVNGILYRVDRGGGGGGTSRGAERCYYHAQKSDGKTKKTANYFTFASSAAAEIRRPRVAVVSRMRIDDDDDLLARGISVRRRLIII